MLVLHESTAAAPAGVCEVEVELAGWFRLAKRLDDGAGADAPASPLVAVVHGVCLVELVPFSAAFAALLNNPPALVATGVADESAVEVPGIPNKLDVPVPVDDVAGVGCVVAATVEDGKLNTGLEFAEDEDEVPLPRALNKDEVVPWDVTAGSAPLG